MKTLYKNAQIYQSGGSFARGDVWAENGGIVDAPVGGEAHGTADGAEHYAIPGLIDIHTHGCAGFDWMNADADKARRMTQYQAGAGVTSFCPSTIAAPLDHIKAAVARIFPEPSNRPPGGGWFYPMGISSPMGEIDSALKNFAESAFSEHIAGFNIEGPFLSPCKAGAQDVSSMCLPDAQFILQLNETTGGLVKLVSIAPELKGAMDFIREISAAGIVCSVAHTNADYELATAAFAAGARHVTHLFNAMPPFLHREPGVIGAAADKPGVTVELICDGVHVHPSVVRAAFRIFGADRITMVSDSMEAAGLGDGVYSLGGSPVEVRGSVARLRGGGVLAGSVSNLMDCLRTAVNVMGIPVADVVRASTETPARVIGLPPPQNAILLDEDLQLVR